MTTMATGRTTSKPRTSGRLVADAVSLGYGDRTVVDALTFVVPDGDFTVYVGNASDHTPLQETLTVR